MPGAGEKGTVVTVGKVEMLPSRFPGGRRPAYRGGEVWGGRSICGSTRCEKGGLLSQALVLRGGVMALSGRGDLQAPGSSVTSWAGPS
mmetsp:Transcript_38757/g.90996  ORF Transcript_38757/g.90996 Transcript_38757/m.90996 type:complete len:88 (+) Transcript_38757:78-341(+)